MAARVERGYSVPFLTEVDPDMRLKGSVDPLGLEQVWVYFGRRVVSNLTTVTTSLRGFTTVMLGLYLAEKLVDDLGRDEAERLEVFLGAEVLAAFSREVVYEAAAGRVLGRLRVRRRLQERRPRVRLMGARRERILSEQKVYGLWGLYMVASRDSGLVEPRGHRLTPAAREHIEGRLQQVGLGQGEALVRLLARPEALFEPRGRDRRLAERVAELHAPELAAEERDFYQRQLLLGGRAGEGLRQEGPRQERLRQERLWGLMQRVFKRSRRRWARPFDVRDLQELVAAARGAGDAELAAHLEQIGHLDRVLGAAVALFDRLLAADGLMLRELVAEVAEAWPAAGLALQPGALAAPVPLARAERAELVAAIDRLARQLASGSYRRAVTTLLEQNAFVMQQRGGSPWVAQAAGRLQVNYRPGEAGLAEPAELYGELHYSYFLGALKSIGAQVQGLGRDHD